MAGMIKVINVFYLVRNCMEEVYRGIHMKNPNKKH